jgi:uncharacterized protein
MFNFMLYQLEIENFYSVRDPQVLDLRIPKSVVDFPERYAELFSGSEERVAKTIALFGPNGSGKSTILKALSFVGWFLRESFEHRGSSLPCERFNDEESAVRPVKLAIELGGDLGVLNTDQKSSPHGSSKDVGTFRYELHLQPVRGIVKKVVYEALRFKQNGKGKWQRVFERNADRSIQGSKTFSLSGFSQVIDKVREDASVVSTLSLFEHQASKQISEAVSSLFRNILIDRSDPADGDVVQFLAHNPEALASLNKELQRIDVGVQEMFLVQSVNGPIAMFKHQGLLEDMPWVLESHGTRAFIRIFPLILMALQRGGIAVIDELDQSIHPLVLPEIVRWFYDKERNLADAQLWMSCHAASLLDDLTKEEVVFCEKDSRGRTKFYSLMDVGTVRRSDNLYKKYLSGSYGAVPQIG